MKQQVILLNGPSSSGKSTLAKALQGLISNERNGRYEVVSIDDFMKISQTETIYEDDVFEISGDICKRALEIDDVIERLVRHRRFIQGGIINRG